MNAINISQVQTVKQILEKDLVFRASMLDDPILEQLRFTVITDVENLHKVFIFSDKGLIARQYEQGKVPKSQLGTWEENPAKVILAVTHVQDNKQEYREKEPLHVNTDGTVVNAEQTTFLLNRVANRHKQDVRANLIMGNAANKSLPETAANAVKLGLSLYDGIGTLISKGKTKGIIAKNLGNLIETGGLTKEVTEDGVTKTVKKTAKEVYEMLVEFVAQLNPDLMNNEEVLIYCSPEFRRLAIKGYMETFSTLAPDVKQNGWKFAEMQNITLLANPIFGKGGQLIATLPGNLEYICDIRPDGGASIEVVQNGDDTNLFDYQTQTAQTTRIHDYSPKVFCVNDAVNVPVNIPAGDYIADVFTVASSDDAEGTAAITSGEKELYKEGDIITVTATPKSGYKFTGWNDGAKDNPYNVTFKGGVLNLLAMFEEEESASSDSSSSN